MKTRALVVLAALVAAPMLAFAQDPASQAMSNAMQKMMQSMHMEPSGDADKDFARMMIPHHEGAIEMAKIELQYGDDPQMRVMAQRIIAAQEAEVAELKAWLAAHP